MGIYVENNNGVIVCNLLIICQREYIHEFRRVYARASLVLASGMKTAVGCTMTITITLTEPAG